MKLKSALIALTFIAVALVSHAEIPREKRVEIDRMLQITGMENLVNQMMSQMVQNMRGTMADVPDDFWDSFLKKVKPTELIELIVPLYDKYYSLEDLRAVNAFYSSPAGQRILKTMPQLMQESMEVGRQWGEKMGRQAMEEALAARKESQ